MQGRLSLTIRTAARLLDSGLVTSSQLSLFCHSMAVAGDQIWGLNAYNHLVPWDLVSEKARESDERRQNGEPLSIFDGIPVSIKSNIAEKNLPLTAGSAILGHQPGRISNSTGTLPSPACGYDADTTRILLREKGGICMGSTSMDEFGMGSLGTNLPRGLFDTKPIHVKNPLPFLQHLRLDDGDDNDNKITVGEGRTGTSSRFDDERLAAIIRMPPGTISEKHHQAMEFLRVKEAEGGNDVYSYSAGGSSSGSAASVAHGSSLLSLGTDTGGSVRLPAAWCGLVGLKPSYGLLSRHGVVSYASSFDTVGIVANSVDCASSALDVLAQRNEDISRDSTFSSYSRSIDVKDTESIPDASFVEIGIAQAMMAKNDDPNHQPLSGIRVGIPASFSVKECPKEISDSWSRASDILHDNGAEIVEISIEDISPGLVQRALSAYYVLVSAEASSNLSRYDGFRYGVGATEEEKTKIDGNGATLRGDDDDMTPLERQYSTSRRQGFGIEVSKRILCGASVLSSDKFHSYYEAAAKLRAVLADEMCLVLDEKVDVLLLPTVLSLPPKIEQDSVHENYSVKDNGNKTAMFANDIMTVPASLAGLPAVSIPVAIEGEETFFGNVQLISSRLGESILLKSASVLQ
uniref:Amidase domain-containing protein n=1 Tax=Pseudo-nitzschia australis TaxID=44445 RepID=A0A7S4EQQ2_9STRA|mmetsp:Transcript_1921/g.4238  ORF Transcript_1921/g.4238 Transcript_1921/m.4238 type:complete len:633 (+) Transcript_1921:204-2102(+)